MNVLLVAEESAGIQALRRLAATPHRIVAVLTTAPTRGGGASVANVARGLGVAVQPSERVQEQLTAKWIRSEGVDLLLNVHSLYVVEPDVVSAPRIGSFNLHPGPLPEYAGLNAPSWAIYHDEQHHGATVHWMDGAIDTGAIAYESHFPIDDQETGLSLSMRCVRESLPLLDRLLEDAASDHRAIPTVAQDLTRRRYYGREVPQQGRLVWSRPAREIVAFVRACDYFPFSSPWGHPALGGGLRRVTVLKAAPTGDPADAPPGTVGEVADEGVRVAAADEWVLIRRVRIDDKIENPAAVLRPGERLDDEA